MIFPHIRNNNFTMLQIFIFLKPIVDMFYKQTWLDVIMLSFATLILLINFRAITMTRGEKTSLGIIVLLTFVLIYDYSVIKIYIKIVSLFLIYAIGRYSDVKEVDKLAVTLKYACELVVIINIITIITGSGFKQWGAANTFCGMYYFKTDLAFAMLFAVIFIGNYATNVFDYLFLIISILMILGSNARMAYVTLCFLLIAKLYMLFCKKNIIRISILILLIALSGVGGIILTKGVDASPIGDKMHYLGTFNIDSIEELTVKWEASNDLEVEEDILLDKSEMSHRGRVLWFFLNANFQGRITIWEKNIYDWSLKGWPAILFGGGYSTASDPHSTYFAILFYVGIVGFVLFVAMTKCLFVRVYKISDGKHFYLAISLLAIIYFNGLTYVTISSTQCTWVPAMIIAVIFNSNNRRTIEIQQEKNFVQ